GLGQPTQDGAGAELAIQPQSALQRRNERVLMARRFHPVLRFERRKCPYLFWRGRDTPLWLQHSQRVWRLPRGTTALGRLFLHASRGPLGAAEHFPRRQYVSRKPARRQTA